MSFQAMAEAVKIRTESATDKLVLLMMANYADENNQCYPSYKRLAADCCMTERGIKAVVGRLRKAGWLTWIQRTIGKSKTSNLYTIHFKRLETPANTDGANHAPPVHRGSERDSLGVVNEIHQGSEPASHKPINEPIKKSTTTTEDNFDNFLIDELLPVVLDMFTDASMFKQTQPKPPISWIKPKAKKLFNKFSDPCPADIGLILVKDWSSMVGRTVIN